MKMSFSKQLHLPRDFSSKENAVSVGIQVEYCLSAEVNSEGEISSEYFWGCK